MTRIEQLQNIYNEASLMKNFTVTIGKETKCIADMSIVGGKLSLHFTGCILTDTEITDFAKWLNYLLSTAEDTCAK